MTKTVFYVLINYKNRKTTKLKIKLYNKNPISMFRIQLYFVSRTRQKIYS